MELNPQPVERNGHRPNSRAALAAVLLQRKTRLWSRFLAAYTTLQQMPRGWRRRIYRKAAVTLAGAALLLALGRTPTLHAANITVDDGRVTIANDGYCSLPEAIINANTNSRLYYSPGECESGDGDDTILLSSNSTFTFTQEYDDYYDSDTALPLITSKITIQGNFSTISRNGDQFRLLAVSASGDLTLNHVEVIGFYSEEAGGAIYNGGGKLTITYSTFSENKSEGDGGALASSGGTTEIRNGIFGYNYAGSDGGALAQFDGGYLTIIRSSIHDNSTDDAGGGIFNDGGTLVIEGGSIGFNSSVSDGGGLYSKGGIASLTEVNIATNKTTGNNGDGGGIINSLDNEMLITNSMIINNEALGSGRGGGILNDETAELTIIGSTLANNKAGRDGGALFNDGGNVETYVTIVNSTISNNQASLEGGGLNGDDGAVTTVINSTITGNSASVGGGVHVDDSAVTTLTRTIVSGNNASSKGREVFNEGGGINAANYNLFGRSGYSNSASFGNFTPSGSDINATDDGLGIPLDTILDTDLGFNGGLTTTHALSENSPAIDAAPSADCAASPVNGLDQRGYLRNANGKNTITDNECDIGAFEYASAPPQFIHMTAAGPGVTDDGVAFGQEDILFWDGLSWSKFFDGTDQGLTAKHDINAIHVNAADDIYLSFFQNKIKTTNLGPVLGQDILHYDGSGFSLFFDGSDVGLTTTAEKIDALHILDGDVNLPGGGSCDAYLLISTLGTGKVPAFGGGQLSFQGEDILGFCLTNSGENTAGFWHMVLDGSAEGMPKNSTDSISASDDGETILLTTKGTFNVDGAFGGHSMIYVFDTNNDEFDGPFFSAPATGLNQKADGLHADEELLN